MSPDRALPASPKAKVLLWIVIAIMVALGGIATAGAIRSANADEAQTRSDEVAGCRSAYRSELVDAPLRRALAALGRGDRDGVRVAAEQAEVLGQRFDLLIELSREDPKRFLRECRAAGP